MMLIEPCCTQKHWPAFRKKLGTDGTAFFQGYGDLSLEELLPVILTRYSETDMMLVAPLIPKRAEQTLLRWLRKTWARADGKGKLNVLSSLTVISNLQNGAFQDNPCPDRLVLHSVQQNDTALILPDLAIYGPINLTYGGHFTAIATKNARTIAAIRDIYSKL